MKFTITIDVDNACFRHPHDDEQFDGMELGRLLQDIGNDFYNNNLNPADLDDDGYPIFDTNGNRVGNAKFID